MIRRLLGILGRRTLLTFGLVTFLVGALLATVNITSRYALKLYVDDQLRRIPWDLAIYQQGAVGNDRSLPKHIASTRGVTRVESLAFLRARFPEGGEVEAQVDRKPFTTPWLCLLAASDPSILPPELSFALEHESSRSPRADDGRGPKRGAVLSLVGPEYAMGKAFLALQGARDFTLQVHVHDQPRFLFNTPINKVVRLDRDELNRWLMDQTGSVSYVPYVGAILLMPYEWDVLTKFDQVATGFVPADVVGVSDQDAGHIQMAEYAPEVVYLARIDRASLVSGWDIPGSLANVNALNARLHSDAQENAPIPKSALEEPVPGHSHEAGEPAEESKFSGSVSFVIDSTTEVLLERMQGIARLIGLVSLLVALPLLWMAWVLAANLAGLLMLNERRTLGLMRLRGISGDLMGRALLVSIVAGGVAGGLLGLAAGSVVPLVVYERGRLPLGVLTEPRQLAMFAAFLLISVVLALVVSRRLVTYAMTISPLEASRRVAGSEAVQASMTFGPGQQLALTLGGYVLFGWIFDFAISDAFVWFRLADRLLDFLGLPLFLYGVASLMASKRERIQRIMAPVLKPIGGTLGPFALRHMSAKPHRTVAFLLIVALMSSVSLYPVITSRSFEDKAVRGARVQLGTDWQVLFNAPDLVDVERLRGTASSQLAALKPEIQKLVASLGGVAGVKDATFMIEAVLPSFYLPGYGLRGVPLYLLASADEYRSLVYSEPSVGLSDDFHEILSRAAGETAVSPPVADFWRLARGSQMLLGLDPDRRAVSTKTAGILAFLPGLPPKSVSDRQGYVQARVDYLNYLFSTNAYLATSADNPAIATLQVLVPRIIVLLRTDAAVDAAAFEKAIVKASPFPPLEIHSLAQEIGKVGSDMYISLALANMRIYLLGGLVLALIAILAVAMANYSEDRRTLALLRIRGASPRAMWRFVVAMLLSPALVGLALGALSSVLAGFGLANYVWRLREIRTVVQLLPTHLVVAPLTGWVVLLLIGILVGVASGFSWWVFRDTAHESVRAA
jgi:FtsX-like permease family protein